MTTLPISLAASSQPSGMAPKSLGTSDFLRLMTEQLKQQDPFAPADNTQMIAQMAQMSATSGIAEMNVSLREISTQLANQSALLAQLVTPTTANAGA
jgi:flagellar basal-body rod modification protein FlgD